ncbi:MAG: hypothetical protein GY938_06285 [Ketobacter sp.]|nr:hypothetical protein [Ketobacter sp.]
MISPKARISLDVSTLIRSGARVVGIIHLTDRADIGGYGMKFLRSQYYWWPFVAIATIELIAEVV